VDSPRNRPESERSSPETDAGGNQQVGREAARGQRAPAMVFDTACGKRTPFLKSCCVRPAPPLTFFEDLMIPKPA
jgi:hypothetical protein